MSITADPSMLTADDTQLLLPADTQYEFDFVIREVIDTLAARNWEAEGVTVSFTTLQYGPCTAVRMVNTIHTGNIVLTFGRSLTRRPATAEYAAVGSIVIGQQQLTVYQEEGPTFYRYAGTDWPGDRQAFLWTDDHRHVNLADHPRTTRFAGLCTCEADIRPSHAPHPGVTPRLLVQKTGEVRGPAIRTDELISVITAYLSNCLLAPLR